MSKYFHRHRSFLFFLFGSFILALIVFGPSLQGKFTLDDHPVIESRLESFTWKKLPSLFFAPWHPAGEWAGNYRPLTLWSLAINAMVSEKTVGFHLVNIFMQALNATLVFLIVKRFSSQRAGVIAGLIFLLLPIHTEPIASIVGRVYLLGTFFSLLSLHYFFAKKYLISAVLLLAALLSGDFFVALVPALGIFLLMETKSLWKSLRIGSLYVVAVGSYFLCRFFALGSRYVFGGEGYVDPVIGPLAYVGTKERVFTALAHLYLYLRKTIIPIDLSPDYSFNQIPIVSSWVSWRLWIGLAVLAIILRLALKGNVLRGVRVAAVLFLTSYVLMSNLFLVTTGTMAERWWYWPSLGLVMLIALGMENLLVRFRSSRQWILGVGGVVLIWFVMLAFQQSGFWIDDHHLFTRAVEKSPQSVWARTNLAEEYFASKQYVSAKAEIEKAMAITSYNPLTLYVLGKINWQENRIEEAEQVFLQAVERDGRGRNRRSLYRTLALLSLDSGQNKKAESYMQEAVQWPVARQKENIKEIDEYLVRLTKELALRKPASYTPKEKEDLVQMIKALRGF